MKNYLKNIKNTCTMLLIPLFLFFPRNLKAQTSDYNFATGNVKGKNYVGGLTGRISGENGVVANSYARGSVTGESHVGGLAGNCDGTVENSYSTGKVTGNTNTGGLTGSGSGAVKNSYWDTQTSTKSTSAGGTGRSSDDMIYPYASNTFTGWNFTGTWIADVSPFQNGGYPILRSAKLCLVSVQVYPPGAGTIAGTGYYKANQQVQLTATPKDAYRFMGWAKGGQTIGTGQQYAVSVTEDVKLVARFESKATPVREETTRGMPGITLYPNPAKDMLRVDLPVAEQGEVTVTVISMTGQTVMQFSAQESHRGYLTFSVKNLKPGLYTLGIRQDNHFFTGKFIR